MNGYPNKFSKISVLTGMLFTNSIFAKTPPEVTRQDIQNKVHIAMNICGNGVTNTPLCGGGRGIGYSAGGGMPRIQISGRMAGSNKPTTKRAYNKQVSQAKIEGNRNRTAVKNADKKTNETIQKAKPTNKKLKKDWKKLEAQKKVQIIENKNAKVKQLKAKKAIGKGKIITEKKEAIKNIRKKHIPKYKGGNPEV